MPAIYKITEGHGRGDPADGSESWEYDIKYQVVDDKDKEEFNEWCISGWENQDYSYTFDVQKVMEVYYPEQLDALLQAIKRYQARCAACQDEEDDCEMCQGVQ